jgi:copper homeostasis protein
MNFKLEICVDTIESAVNAQVAGADRVELCNNLAEGGTTPSYGTISSARENLTIGLNVIIRPRGGDFLYTDQEYDIMRRDIDKCGECGVDGIVIGILCSDGTIDINRTAKLVEMANPMAVTFHRAFDMSSNPVQGLEDIISAGASRILTSGQKNKVPEGAVLISRLVKRAGSRIIIMPGGGLDESNIADTARITGAHEFHLTGKKIVSSDMQFRREGIAMGSVADIPEFSRKVADIERIKNIINILKMI